MASLLTYENLHLSLSWAKYQQSSVSTWVRHFRIFSTPEFKHCTPTLCISSICIRSRQEVDKRRHGNTSTCHLNLSLSLIAVPQAHSFATRSSRNIKSCRCHTPIHSDGCSMCACVCVCVCVLPQKVPSLCSSYITFLCVGLPTSRFAAWLRGNHKVENGSHTPALAAPCSHILARVKTT